MLAPAGSDRSGPHPRSAPLIRYVCARACVCATATLSQAEKSKVADALEEVTFQKGHTIIREKDNGDFFYFLMMVRIHTPTIIVSLDY